MCDSEYLIYRPFAFSPERIVVEYMGLTRDGRIIVREVNRKLPGVLIVDQHQIIERISTRGESNG